MSVGSLLLRELVFTAIDVVSGLFAWVFIAPVAVAMPRRRDWVAVIGRGNGEFLDNAKYFFLDGAPLLSPLVRAAFVTERRQMKRTASDTDYEVIVYPTLMGIYFLIRAGTVVVDSTDWVFRFRRFLLIGAKKLQLWHGVGFKRIELDKWRNEANDKAWLSSKFAYGLRTAKRIATGRLVRYDAVVSTSKFYRDNVFAGAFLSKTIIVTGYPRNTFGGVTAAGRKLAWHNVDSIVGENARSWIKEGRKIVLVAPTFRDSRATPMGLNSKTAARLDSYCHRYGIELVFNFHPLEHAVTEIAGKHFHVCASGSDLYPLMPFSSALITDYSSIYMDYLLLDRPITFLVFDLLEYLAKDRQIQFDYEDMTPGPKVVSWDEAMRSLRDQWRCDSYACARSYLRTIAFDNIPQEESTSKVITFMHRQHWLPLPTKRDVGPQRVER